MKRITQVSIAVMENGDTQYTYTCASCGHETHRTVTSSGSILNEISNMIAVLYGRQSHLTISDDGGETLRVEGKQ